MKSVVILSPAHPLRGGIASSTHRMATALQEHNYNVTIFSFSLQYPDFLFPGKTQYSDDPPPTQLKIESIINSISPPNWIKIGLKIRALKPDYIICRYWLPFMGPCLGTILRIIRSNRKTKILALVDNAIPHEKRPGDYLFTKYFIGSCDGFIVMSRSVETDIRTFTATKPIVFNPHPLYDNYGSKVDKAIARRELGLSDEQKYILFFGFIRDYKGLDLLLHALADPRLKQLGIHLIIAGEYYGKQDYYEGLIQQLDLTNRIVAHTKFIPHKSVKYYFSAVDLVVQPYRTATQSGISQLAYHFDKPMVVTKVGGLPEIVPNQKVGFVTDVDHEAIAGAIVQFFEKNLEATFVQNIQQRKQVFSWEHMVQSIEQLMVLQKGSKR